MALTGDLGSIDLANVFQMLQLSQKTGTLEIRCRGARTEIYLDGEAVLYPFDRDAFPQKVLRLLQRTGRVGADAVDKARASVSVLKRDILSVLVGTRAITAEVVAEAYREQMSEEVYELFSDRDATFEFRENEQPRGHGKVIDANYRLPGNGLLMEAARRVDEWGYIREKVSSDLCVFEAAGRVDQVPEEERDGALLEVFANLDGKRPVRALVDKTGLTRFTVCKKLALLANLKIVYEIPLEVLVERARACLREQKANEGLALLERAFELGASEPRVHEMASLAYQALQRVGDACRHQAMVAEALERAGDRKGAAEVHLRIRDLMPTNVRSRERLVRHWLDDPAFFKNTKFDAEQESVELVQILRELGRETEACKLLVEVQQRYPTDARLTWKLADLAVDSGDPKSAVAMLMSCAEEMLHQRQHVAALRLFRRVRSIDPSHEGLDRRIDQCERATRPVAVARSGHVTVAIASILLIGGAVALFAHNSEAFARLEEIDTEELILSGDFSTALGTLAAFRSEHPATIAAIVARERIEEIEGRRTAWEAERAERDDLLKSESERAQHAAERLYQDAMKKLAGKDLAGALEGFRQATERATDPSWIETAKPAQKSSEIEGYLRDARTTFAAYEAARQKNDWAKAHDFAVKLAKENPDAPEARQLKIPIRITTIPGDTQIEVEGTPGTFTSPAILLLPAGRVTKLHCRRTGLMKHDLQVTPETSFEVEARLDRCPDKAGELPLAPIAPPAVLGATAYFPCESGRLLAVDVKTLTEKWRRQLPNLMTFTAPIVVDDKGLKVTTRADGGPLHVWLDPDNGDEVAREDADGPPTAAKPSLTVRLADKRTLAGELDGRIVLKSSTGATLDTWLSPGPIKWGVALPGGGALFGGGRLVLRVEFPGK